MPESINVSVAISLKEAVTAIAEEYQAKTGCRVSLTFGSTGQLASQIENGAPVDVFISAANKQVDELCKAGLADSATRRVIATNTLVLIVPADAPNAPASFRQLSTASVQKVAIGDPRTVPAGQYAMEVLTSMHLADALKTRLVYGSNVRQVLNYVERGEVSASIVYATDARQAGTRVRVVDTADASTHEPIVYTAVVIKGSKTKQVAQRFAEYLVGDSGKALLSAQGFASVGPTLPIK